MKYPLSPNTKAEILSAINTALESGKSYAVEVKLHDNSLRARQRALANIWYKELDSHFAKRVGYHEAYSKYRWGLVLLSEDDPDKVMMICRMLDDCNDWPEKVELIRSMYEFFPIMRARGGLDAEKQASYLQSMQRHFAEYGCILSSPREDDLLKCRQAHQ